MSESNKAIGGYFELELPPSSLIKHNGALRYQSARAAFLALLGAHKPKRVWMPYYICDSMLASTNTAGVEVCFYSLNRDLGIADDIVMECADILLYVNYFGVCFEEVKKVLRRFNPSQVVMDFSQAFYAEPQKCLATIYSPRKFFGIPDGGELCTQLEIELPEVIDSGSEYKMSHLIKRLGGTPEMGYADYRIAETSLDDLEPKQISVLTYRLLSSINYEAARVRRNENFYLLHRYLENTNNFTFASKIDGPLCYPYFSDNTDLRDKLIANRIFIPTYWADVLSRTDEGSLEYDFVDKILAIPCDQRYSQNDMNYILSFF